MPLFQQSPREMAEQLRLELDARNPQVRLSIINLLCKLDVEPDRLLLLAEEITGWIGQDFDALLSEFIDSSSSSEGEDEAEKDAEAVFPPSVMPDRSGYL